MNFIFKGLIRLCFLLGAVSLSASACGIFNDSEERVVINVGTREITVKKFEIDIKHFTSGMGITNQGINHIIDPLVDKIVDHYLMLEYGRENGIDISESELESAIKDIKRDYQEKSFQEMLLHRYIDFEEWKEGLRQQLLIKKIIKKISERITPITFHETKTYFDSHKDEFMRPEMVKFRQIVTRTKEEAEKILASLNNGADMAELGRKYSIAPVARKEAEVGWTAREDLDEAMEKVVFSLPVGKISSVVKTPYGFHIFEVVSKRSEGLKSLPEAREEIQTKLFHQKEELSYSKWLKDLRGLFPVTVNQKVLRTLEFGN